jgi:hypothetical protein
MEWLANLPPQLQTVKIPTLLSATRLASSGDCILKAIVPATACPTWPPSPEAEFGRVAHSLMDLAVKGKIEFGGGNIRAVQTALDELLDDARVRLASTPDTHEYADLRTAFTQREWGRRTSLAIARTLELLNSGLHTAANREPNQEGKRILLRRALHVNGFAASEVTLESRTLRLQGRLDFLRVLPETIIEISDFKSGNVLNEEGDVDDVTALQLRLYGLGILDLAPEARLELKVVSRGRTSPVSFSTQDIKQTREWLAERTLSLGDKEWIGANELAVLGPQCRGCKARAICPKYRSSAAALWKSSDLTMQLPLDIAGRILEVEPCSARETTLKLTDLAGRIVKIHRLSSKIKSTAFDTKSLFWFFNLATSERTMQNGKWRHPRNFHELPASTLERRAWTLKTYRGASASQRMNLSDQRDDNP